ncbi:MAG TPA: TIGR00730 family Rossman fold protein [Acidimicrobiales bacterium]|nr:TIGR00730 family Rossman fold protein [Acidimicrobiales bacterium]|tara:strand:- start:158 stop:1195 length:1038 start_codon:yes stop_codon:yes gene_type:complete
MNLSNYRTGVQSLDLQIVELLKELPSEDADLIAELLVSGVRLSLEDVNRGELKLTNSALKELRHSFSVFAPYRSERKATLFGSARISAGDPAYVSAREFGAAMAQKGWMVMTGAGPGIMAAGLEGAGKERSFGINIKLPFESSANEFIADDPKLINFKYFFTRKVIFMKETHGYALLPGGFGTMDEAFELLTLMQTGKSPLTPVVLLDPPGSTYWDRWIDFVRLELLDGGLISENDLSLMHVYKDPEAAADHLCHFYSTYHSMRYAKDRLIIRLNRAVSDNELASLNLSFSDLLLSGSIERISPDQSEVKDSDFLGLDRIAFRYNQSSQSRLRLLIDSLNDYAIK